MAVQTPEQIIADSLATADQLAHQETDGKWLEGVTAFAGEHIREWDLSDCDLWDEWEEREVFFPGLSKQDVGIDAVGRRRSDGRAVAIQCKSRKLDEQGIGGAIGKSEIDKFAGPSSHDHFAERWIVTNGANPATENAIAIHEYSDKPIKLVNIVSDMRNQQGGVTQEDCPHCDNPEDPEAKQTKSCMQAEAIDTSVRILREHVDSDSGGLPKGQARGRIVLPCGTGKTRISLRIVERLTDPGDLSIVLCPSIALVAQIRREYLQHREQPLRVLAVCSDQTAGYDPKQEDKNIGSDDPTVDKGNVRASAVKGMVTTNSDVIAEWIQSEQGADKVNVIFGTYQSGSRVAEALQLTNTTAQVMIADEAHRTAGLKRKSRPKTDEEQRLRDFTLCHDNDEFPAVYRVYQTATPRIYDVKPQRNTDKPSDWVVRTMDDEQVFGVELYRKSYVEAVNNNWLSDYRIIALGINDPDSYALVNQLAQDTKSTGRRKLTSSDYLRGLAFTLAIGGATFTKDDDGTETVVPIQSCIAFMNTVDKSKNMAQDLQLPTVKNWLRNWMLENRPEHSSADYRLQHLDASSDVASRDNAKDNLAKGTVREPHGILNVGIFGEGTDSPSLSAVAFLEARKSPIDVIQAVGRAMRTSPGKQLGYIICPILIPPHVDPETWLSTSGPEEGWQELGQILRALRAHDSRIEDELSDLIELHIPPPPEEVRTIVAIADHEKKRVEYREHIGPVGEAEFALQQVIEGKSTLSQEFMSVAEPKPDDYDPGTLPEPEADASDADALPEPTQLLAAKRHEDGSIEMRRDTPARTKPKAGEPRGQVDVEKSKTKAKKMINDGAGVRVKTPVANPKEKRKRQTADEIAEQSVMRMLDLTGLGEHGNAIRMNLLSKSGLTDNRVQRDLNLLEDSVKEAAFHLRQDELGPTLDQHFGLHNLKQDDKKKSADGCTIAALLMMNAAMLHQRIAHGRWLNGVSDLEQVKNDVNVVRRVEREWNRIMRHDFRPVLEPAVCAIEAVDTQGKLSGLERALRHIAAEAERIAETYADMGADHAGPLFNKVMGNQASDGAYFTRPIAASLAARLTLDACGDVDWTDPQVWRAHKTVDLACGSGTLLAAMLTELKRCAREQGASEDQLVDLQKLAVEETIKGLDINPVSLQLAASQLTAGNREIRYRQMGLHLMPYGPSTDNPALVQAGTLELLGQKAIVPRDTELGLADDGISSQLVWDQPDDAELEDAVDAVKDARIVIMNPPFTNRANMGQKFPSQTQQTLRRRTDGLEATLVRNDADLSRFVDKNAIRPLFVGLADRCLDASNASLVMVTPTISLTAPSGIRERQVLAERYHIRTIVTCHQPGQINMSQNTSINESIIIGVRHDGPKPPTRFINLDRFPATDDEVTDFHQSLARCYVGLIDNGWGEVSEWPAERIAEGDWSAAIWRSPELADAATRYANDTSIQTIEDAGLSPWATGQLLRGSYEPAVAGLPDSFPILKSKGADAQRRIQSRPDDRWIAKNRDDATYRREQMLQKAGYLLVSAGQRTNTARLTAVAGDHPYVGNGWMPVTGLSSEQAKALAAFVNSTPRRLQLMRNPGRTLDFPIYSTAEASKLRVPDFQDDRIRRILAECWELTKDEIVPQFRDDECDVRRLWDEAVAEAMGWDPDELTRLRLLLHREPHVRGLGYNQYADAE